MDFDTLINNPGLQHIMELILWHLDDHTLFVCRFYSQSWNKFVCKPRFWLKKCWKHGLIPDDNQKSWTKLVNKAERNGEVEDKVTLHLMKLFSMKNERWFDPLNFASTFGDLDLVTFILENVDSTFFQDKDGDLPIHRAAINGHIEVVKILAGYSPANNPNEANYFGNTPIQYAARYGHIEIIRFLCTSIKNPNAPSEFGHVTPLHYAAEHGHFEIVKLLASFTSKPNAPGKYDRKTPIHLAAINGHADVVKFLANITDDPNMADVSGWTPIHYASEKGDTEVVKALAPFTDTPNSPDPKGWTPIHTASENGHVEVLKVLVACSPNPNDPEDDHGNTPIHLAADFGIVLYMYISVKSIDF